MLVGPHLRSEPAWVREAILWRRARRRASLQGFESPSPHQEKLVWGRMFYAENVFVTQRKDNTKVAANTCRNSLGETRSSCLDEGRGLSNGLDYESRRAKSIVGI